MSLKHKLCGEIYKTSDLLGFREDFCFYFSSTAVHLISVKPLENGSWGLDLSIDAQNNERLKMGQIILDLDQGTNIQISNLPQNDSALR